MKTFLDSPERKNRLSLVSGFVMLRYVWGVTGRYVPCAVRRSRILRHAPMLLLFIAAPAIAQSNPTSAALASSASSELPVGVQPAATPPASQLSRSDTAPNPSENRIVLNLSARRVYLYRGDMLVSSYPVAVGTAETPTPQGQFVVQQMVVNPVWQSPWTGEVHEPGPNSALGLRWIEFATSDAGAFGFHGTPTLESIGKAASNGCVRMRNEDVVALFSQVSVGTTVVVEP